MIRTADIDAIDLPEGVTAEMIRAELDRLGLAITEAASLLRINERTLRRYLQEPGSAGYTPMPFATYALLKHLKVRR